MSRPRTVRLFIVVLGFLAAGVAALGLLRLADRQADAAEWARLQALQPAAPQRFQPHMVAGLPEPARRYFGYTIRPGTPLWPVAEIEMGGRFSLGNKDDPAYQPMQARQILAAPHGFVWQMRTLAGLPVSGSDSGDWTRFRLFGLVPVARLGGNPDHARAAYGRFVAEAVFWTPAALLPGPGVDWQALGADTARVTVTRGALSQAVDLTVDAQGAPVQVVFQRWSDANPDRVYRLQPFGGRLADFRDVQGYRLPFQVEAGNQFGTDDYFAFFFAEVSAIRFLQPR